MRSQVQCAVAAVVGPLFALVSRRSLQALGLQ
jgi:hypothetical protein